MSVELNLIDIFQSPTVARLAALIYERETQVEDDGNLASLLAEIENMSDEDAEKTFAEESARKHLRLQTLKSTAIATGTAALEILTNTV
jgi:hypothetical protein